MKSKQLKLTGDRDTFDYLWKLEDDWFEPPNYRRGGWSGVVKSTLPEFMNGEVNVFIKRQEKHLALSWKHCRKIPTFQREYINILSLDRRHIPTLEVVYFGKKNTKAILVTKALDEFNSLESISPTKLAFTQRKALITQVAKVIQALHQSHFQHNCLYPKHIFIAQQNNQWKAKLIDLEKLKKRVFKKHAMHRDLSTLSRHLSKDWSMTDRMRFFKAYVGEAKLSGNAKKTWRTLAKKMQRKRR